MFETLPVAGVRPGHPFQSFDDRFDALHRGRIHEIEEIPEILEAAGNVGEIAIHVTELELLDPALRISVHHLGGERLIGVRVIEMRGHGVAGGGVDLGDQGTAAG